MRFSSTVMAAAVCALALAGCGSDEKECLRQGIRCENLPRKRTYAVNWTERAPNAATFGVRRIEVGPDGWRVTASITNTSKRTFTFPTGGPQSPESFGLGVFTSPLVPRVEVAGQYLLQPKNVSPPFPRELRPGETWSGTMSSNVPPRNKRWLRVLFGVFFWRGEPPAGLGPFFAWSTSHTVQAPGPVGTTGTDAG